MKRNAEHEAKWSTTGNDIEYEATDTSKRLILS